MDERYTTEMGGPTLYEHWHRYAHAAAWTAGKRVLDAASGSGYGSAFLAGGAGSVFGIELDHDAVEHASLAYKHIKNLTFSQGDVTRLPFPDRCFDVVTSFETLEHIRDPEAALIEFKRVLTPQGLLIASTPDRLIYTDKLGQRNKYHVCELSRPEFERICARHFANHAIVGQKLYYVSLIAPDDSQLLGRQKQLACFSRTDGAPVHLLQPIEEAVYMIAFCSNGRLDLDQPKASIFVDNDRSVQGERDLLIGWSQSIKRKLDRLTEEKQQWSNEQDLRERLAAVEQGAAPDPLAKIADALDARLGPIMTDLEAMRTSHATAALDLAERFNSWFRTIGRDLEDLRSAVDRDRRDSQIATTEIRRRLTDEIEQAEARETLLRHRLDAVIASRSWGGSPARCEPPDSCSRTGSPWSAGAPDLRLGSSAEAAARALTPPSRSTRSR